MTVHVFIVPSDENLLAELRRVKVAHPEMGVQRLSGQLHEDHPDWRINAKRVRRVLKEHGLLSPASAPSPGTSPCCVASPLAEMARAQEAAARSSMASSTSSSTADADAKLAGSGSAEEASDPSTPSTADAQAGEGDFVALEEPDWAEDMEDEWVLVPH